MVLSRWGATHVLSVERLGKMVEIEVRQQGGSLFTVLEWTGHEVAEWTLEEGRLCYCGERWEGKAMLLPLPGDRLTLDAVLASVRRHRGDTNVGRLARELGREEREVAERLRTLFQLGLLQVPGGELDGRPSEAVH